ncbi:2-amino-4-hydroxy-6-hydroxymethyldihydropteridine diphosphokinase [Pantoea sp. Nvir]|uniref:2-amino-4-hydroxy-6- hydroxymethyldihydropteridine diphosphokinase n=1 Tax=Pantoea sp. Nvir TaxID=2576760 RepID=UPI00135A1894|nr:2-amino-4-hydroxy-6-hydroxymethyldihydropteridine diphosphokinase [Pantoea sp. Nvir]MXP66869.1 2-amino-4-hydroxy-6-hydroxymethyldihydropteridine diphosphokinase [Pantoea sp. Nvir]CAJ0991324.1 2-amino-4-hydroxy-6-hydroxymethyldihydropteridinepyrophosphokinase [Pantoea sp. Nvir]
MTRVYLALGSNLADPLYQVNTALMALDELPNTIRVATSSFYRTRPYGPIDQPDYLNAVVALDTQLTPETLLNHIQCIELNHGRIRKAERWAPRTLDIDILLFGQLCISTPRLIVPHYDICNRPFVLVPLLEITPDVTLPDNRSLRSFLTNLEVNNIQRWEILMPHSFIYETFVS